MYNYIIKLGNYMPTRQAKFHHILQQNHLIFGSLLLLQINTNKTGQYVHMCIKYTASIIYTPLSYTAHPTSSSYNIVMYQNFVNIYYLASLGLITTFK